MNGGTDLFFSGKFREIFRKVCTFQIKLKYRRCALFCETEPCCWEKTIGRHPFYWYAHLESSGTYDEVKMRILNFLLQ